MLGALRRATKSWYVRGFLILLASTFALIFGSGGSIFSGLGNQPVANVGAIEISQQDFRTAYVRQLNQYQGITPDQARSLGLPESTLAQMVGGALIDSAAKDLGVAVPDALVAAEIRGQYPGLTNNLIERTLNQRGLTVMQYQTLLRESIIRTLVADTMAPQPPAPRILAETIFRYRQEERVAEVLDVPAEFIAEISESTATALTEYYNANINRYTAPEYRNLAFVTLQPEDVMDTVAVSEPEIVEEYESRIREFTTISNRGISELRFSLEETALNAQARMEAGAQFAAADPRALRGDPFVRPAEGAEPEPEVADDGPVGVIDRGEITQDQLPPEIAEAVFALGVGTISAPMQSTEGWHIYRIDSVERGGTLSLEEAREQVTADLLRDRALGVLYDLSIDLDDALGGGDTLEQAANRLGLVVQSSTVDAEGLDRDGNPSDTLPPFANFMPTAYQTGRGNESLVIETIEGGYFVVRVDGVELPGPIPFNEVADQVKEHWAESERLRLTKEFAEALFERAKLGTDLAALGAEAGIEVKTSSPFTRAGSASSGLSPQLVGQMFTLAVGESALAPSSSGGIAIGRLMEILPADPAANEEAIADLIGEFSADMSQDLLVQYQGALEAEFGVDVDFKVFEQATFAATSQGAVGGGLPAPNPFGGF